ncbi:MAG TPA: hypothetical protein PKE64_28225 [Anaerolineae bacterium]|nr:hypothetical protein [Anaerolineae bacterium]
MNIPQRNTHLSVVLSRDEVLAILRLVNLSDIPGLGEEPIPGLSPEQQALSLIVAERGLRARGLAVIDAEGRLRLHSDVLRMLGVCAAPSLSLYVTLTALPAGEVKQLIAHLREDTWVLQTRPEPVLHAFMQLDNWPQVLQQLRAFCQWPSPSPKNNFHLTIPTETLKTVQELVAEAKLNEANHQIIEAGNSLDDAAKLTTLLSQPHIVTVIQQVSIKSTDSVAIQSVTLLYGNDSDFLVARQLGGAEAKDGMTTIQPIEADGLDQLLTKMILQDVKL